MEATELFEDALRWLKRNYTNYRFFTERDVVWTLQLRILQVIEEHGLPYRVFNEHSLRVRGRTRADLAILGKDSDSVEVAAEFKYEPSHSRRADRGGDILPSKLVPSVVFWSGEGSVEKDVMRVHEYTEQLNVKRAFSIFIDEGGWFRHRNPHPGSEWTCWGKSVWVLRAQSGQ